VRSVGVALDAAGIPGYGVGLQHGVRRVWESSAAASVAFLCGGFSIDANAIAVEAELSVLLF